MLLTLGSLRADLVAALGGEPPWTASIDGFAEEADWTGRAIAASSSPIPALGTLATGVDPWHHMALHHRVAHLDPSLPTLASAVAEQGFETIAYLHLPEVNYLEPVGFWRDFERTVTTESLARISDELAKVRGRQLVWVHLPEVAFPIEDRREDLPRLASRPPGPASIDRGSLMPYADPDVPMPEELRSSVAELVRHETAWVDRQAGRLLRALSRSPDWPRMTLILTAVHGMEIDEHGQSLFAQNLGRESIEVPLLIKLPENLRKTVLDPQPRVGAGRIWSTILTLAGGQPSPVHLPSLFERSDRPMLSVLYDHDSMNRYSWVDPGPEPIQLLWQVPFAEPSPVFFDAQTIEATRPRDLNRFVFARQDDAFLSVAPAIGRGRAWGALERWLVGGGTRTIEDEEGLGQRVEALNRRLLRFAARPRTVGEEAIYRSSIPVAAPPSTPVSADLESHPSGTTP